MPDRVVVLGVGNPARGDDAAGRAVARLLRESLAGRAEIRESEGEASGVLAALEGFATAIIVDACLSRAEPGTVHRFDAEAGPLPQVASDLSTHGFGVASAIELARNLGQLPQRTVVYAIEGASFEIGAPLSEPVVRAVAQLVRRIMEEIGTNAAIIGGE